MHRGPEPQWRSSAAPRQALRASPPPCSSCMALAWIDRSACVPPPPVPTQWDPPALAFAFHTSFVECTEGGVVRVTGAPLLRLCIA